MLHWDSIHELNAFRLLDCDPGVAVFGEKPCQIEYVMEGVAVPKRFLTQTEFATLIGVRQVTAARLLKDSKLSATRVKCGKANRILVDANQSAIPRTTPGKIFRKKEAAKRLGISVSLLEAIKETGIYEINNLLPTRAGFHELDLKAFSQKLFALAPESNCQDTSGLRGITLKDVACGHYESSTTKLGVVRALLTKGIAIVGNANGTIGRLLLDRFAYRKFIVNARLSATANAASPEEISRQLLGGRSPSPARSNEILQYSGSAASRHSSGANSFPAITIGY